MAQLKTRPKALNTRLKS